jgi:hypothetical protein
MTCKLVYINRHAACYGWFFGRRMPRGYRLAAKFWGSGLLDRSNTLKTGFPSEILYPLPEGEATAPADATSIEVLCDQMGQSLVQEALKANKQVQVLWSGGIDSTAAMVGLLKAATAAGCTDRIEALLSKESVKEYPSFYNRFVKQLRLHFVTAPVTSHLDPQKLIVTGEHGDQIFGSAKAMHYVFDGRAFDTYHKALPSILLEALGTTQAVDAVLHYLQPLFDSCPIKLQTVFDAFWWINFTLKWQIVGLRLAVFRVTDVKPVFEALRHYFTHANFQKWSLANHDKKIQDTWESYKMPLKDYIFKFTGDADYRRNKVKLPSLKAVFLGDTLHPPPAFRVLMDQKFEPVFWRFDRRRTRLPFTIPARNRGL